MAPSMAPVIGSTSSWISKSWRRDASIGTSRPQLRIQILSAQEIQKSYPLPLSDVYVYIYVYCVFIYYVSIIFYHLIESNDHYSLSRLTLGYFWQDPGHDSVSLLRRFKVSVWTSGVDRHPQISQIQILQLTSTYHNLPIISPVKRPVKRPSFWDPIDIDGGSNRTTGFPPWPPWRAWSRLTARRRHRTGASLIELDDGNMFNRKARSIWW